MSPTSGSRPTPATLTPASPPTATVRAAGQQLLLTDFDAVVREHQRGIYRLLLGWTRDEERADALTQETFLRAWRYRSGFRGDAAVATWLRRIAIHAAEDDRRSRRQGLWRRIFHRPADGPLTEPDEMPEQAPSAERSVLGREALGAVWKAVGELPKRQQQVFRLRHFADLPLREIADLLGLAEGTVKVHLSRATHAVRAATQPTRGPSP